MSDNRSDKTNYFFTNPTRKEVFTKKKTTHKETCKHIKELKLAVTLSKVINHFFPGLLPALARVNDPRNASYITYSGKVILMTRILSSVFYISSMRKSSEEFNSDKVIQNIGYLCNEELEEEKQDFELTAAKQLMKRLKEEFPMLPICISADSLYASETILKECKEKGWTYLLRFKEAFHQRMKSMKA